MSLNAPNAADISNDNFTGSFLFMHRSPDSDGRGPAKASPYDWHFVGKSRRWEARVQGRFRKKTSGTLWTGCVLEDFDYSTEQSWAASVLANAVVPLMETVVGESFYFAWGARGEAADQPDAELATIVTCLAGVDQLIVTPAGTSPVPIHCDISDLGLRRNAMSAAAYHSAVQQVAETI